MNNLCKPLLMAAVGAVVWASVHPSIMSAQTSGVGSDGNTRVLWRATNGSVSVWKVDASLNYVDSHIYGPYDGWTPLSLAVSSNNRTYLLWRNTNGQAALWWLDENLAFGNSVTTGPYYAWIPETLSVSTANPYDLRLIWKNTNGSVTMWILNADLTYLNSRAYGPYFGYDPGPAGAAVKAPLSQGLPSRDGDARAAAAMQAQRDATKVSMPQ